MRRRTNRTLGSWLVALVAAAVLPTLVAAAVALVYAYREERHVIQDGLRDTTRALALVVDRELATRESIAQTLAGSPTLTYGDLRAFHEYATNIAPTRDKVVVLHALDGAQLVNTRVPFGTPLPKTSSLTPQRQAIGPTATLVSNLYFAPIGRQFSFAVQVPVVRDGKPIYYLSLAGYASALQAILQDQRVPDGWTASILDRRGVIVARNIRPETLVGKPFPAELLARMARSPEGVVQDRSLDDVPLQMTFSKSPVYGWAVVMGVPVQSVLHPYRVAAAFAGLGLLLLAASCLAAMFIGRRLSVPVQRLTAASRNIGTGQALADPSTGLAETDEVLAALREADRRVTEATQVANERRREAEDAARALRTSEERLRQLANTMPNLAWIADAEGSVIWFNQRWYDYTGSTLEEVQGAGWSCVHHPDTLPEVQQRWRESVGTGEPFEMPFVPLRGKDGVFRPFYTRAVPLRDPAGAIVQWFGTNTDVSLLKEAEEKLRDADRRKDEFLAMLAHELRNPLAPVRTAAEILRRVGTQDPQVVRASEIIARQVGHMSGLLSDLLDVSRITRGLVTVETASLAVADVLTAALEQVRPLLLEKGHEVSIVQRDAGLRVVASALRLTQVVANLLDNAAKYSPPRSHINVEVTAAAGRVRISVADDGEGIDPRLLPHVFEPFTQAERGAHRSRGGLGLGLAVVRGLVELQGGTVTAHSAGPGQGSRFEVELPQAVTAPEGNVAEGPGLSART